MALPYINAALLTLQLVINAKQDAFSPLTSPTSTSDIPIAPAGYAFLIWLVIYVFTAAHVFTDCFRRELSIYELSPTPMHLRLCFTASCVFNMLWIVLNNWLQWINVATLDLVLLAMSLAPIYWFLCKKHLVRTSSIAWYRYFASELAIRLYFSWVIAATLLCLTMSLQDLSGAYLSFETYAILLSTLLVLGLVGVIYGGDPVVGLVVTWALIGLAKRTDVSSDPALQHTAELLRASAVLAAPILPAMIVASAVHQHVLGRQQNFKSATDVELAKPVSSYHSDIRYGATPAP